MRLDHSAGAWLPSPAAADAPQRGPELTRLGAHLSRQLGGRLTVALGVDNLTDLRTADESPLTTYAEPPRAWRLALVGHW